MPACIDGWRAGAPAAGARAGACTRGRRTYTQTEQGTKIRRCVHAAARAVGAAPRYIDVNVAPDGTAAATETALKTEVADHLDGVWLLCCAGPPSQASWCHYNV